MSFPMSVIRKPPCVRAEAGSSGVFHVKSVMGFSAWDSRVNDTTGGIGVEKL